MHEIPRRGLFSTKLFEPAPGPRCQACHRPVGDANPIRETVGTLITGCKTCTPERRKVG